MPPTDQERQEFREHALSMYEELRDQLEREHHGELLALEPTSGEYVIAKTIGQASNLFRSRFGMLPAFYIRIGGGSVVRTGGAIHGRAS
ncbi:MAG: hypothetical protein CMJ78_08125 [Planctomycetaceae bacterium]|nr:hypothetical protein [Planctomycetaceae bacterium]